MHFKISFERLPIAVLQQNKLSELLVSDTWHLRHDLFFHISILENIWRLSLLRILTLCTVIAVSLISLTPNRKNLY